MMSKALVLGAAALALFASAASTAMAQNGPPTGGQPPVAGGAAGYPGYGYGYGAVAPATGGSTIIIVTPGPAYTAPPVASGYYGAPVVSQPIYDYTPGYWNRGYWGRYGYGWR